MAVKIKPFQKPIIILSCYRSPSNTVEDNDILVNSLTDLLKKYKSNPLWIGGDFNLPDLDWDSYTITGSQYPQTLNEKYLEIFDLNSLNQVVNFPTRKSATLELLLTNRPAFIEDCRPTAGFGDHQSAVLSDIYCHSKRQKPVQRKVFNWKRANIEGLKNEIKVGTEKFLKNESVNTPVNCLWLKFKEILLSGQENNVPSRIISKRFNQRWFNRDCKRMIRKKNIKFKIYQRTKLLND